MMRTSGAIVIACGLFGCAGQPPAVAEPGWAVYHNAGYGYRIAYPDGYEVTETGPAGERDGRSIRIGLEEYAALAPALDITVRPTTSLHETAAGHDLRDLRVEVQELEIGGAHVRQVEFRWATTGQLAFVEIHGEDVLFLFYAPPGTEAFRGSTWWKIVSTFRFDRTR